MLTESVDRSAAREALSALADGELDAARVGEACLHWRGDGELRSSWHTYQIIGDVLRSGDLGCDPAHDAGFLAALRTRLAEEPVVLAPEARASGFVAGTASPVRQRAWRTSSAVAAGFAVVAGVWFVTRSLVPGAALPASPALARAAVSGGFQTAAAVASPAPGALVADRQALIANGQLIHDARLDRYLSAHKEFAGSSALGVPSGFLRNATVDADER